MNFPDSELWNFSVQTYSLPDVENTCLHLQNSYDVDINIILYCLWIAEQGYAIGKDDAQLLIQTALPWQQSILKPLRDARKMMKQHIIAMPADMLDQTVSNLGEMELNAEHMTQLALEKAIEFTPNEGDERPETIECATSSITTYLQQLESINAIADVSDDLTRLLNAVYQNEEAVQVALMSAQVV